MRFSYIHIHEERKKYTYISSHIDELFVLLFFFILLQTTFENIAATREIIICNVFLTVLAKKALLKGDFEKHFCRWKNGAYIECVGL